MNNLKDLRIKDGIDFFLELKMLGWWAFVYIASKFVKNGAVIASGLTLRCDGIAHRAAFKFNMLTITILPSRIKEIIPKQNTDLANKISINGGLIISKYYKDTLNFKEQMSGCVWRDRLQALFSDMVV